MDTSIGDTRICGYKNHRWIQALMDSRVQVITRLGGYKHYLGSVKIYKTFYRAFIIGLVDIPTFSFATYRSSWQTWSKHFKNHNYEVKPEICFS